MIIVYHWEGAGGDRAYDLAIYDQLVLSFMPRVDIENLPTGFYMGRAKPWWTD